MPFQNPFAVAGRNVCSLFEIRVENDFIVLRGGEHEATGQILKGVVVLCLRDSMKVEDVHLRLQGNCRLAWVEGKQTPTGIHNQKIDRTTTILKHTWPPFVGGDGSHHHKTLSPGNYEWPFELTLPGDTSESVEGLYQTGIFYHLKATISRGKLAKNNHAYKRVRIIRTLDPSALEFNHAMSVENVWPNKVEYSVVVPQKAVVFGANIPLEMRFTPLLKGLDIGSVTVKLLEIQEFSIAGYAAPSRSHKHERDVTIWNFDVKREEHWHDTIEDTGQEGWLVNKEMPLPKKLGRCIQDCSVHGIKIRHKLKLIVTLKNPDGHVSELRATLPVTIFISPNMPLDEEGNLVDQAPTTSGERRPSEVERSNMAPPGYGQHVLDQLYDNVEPSGMMTPGVMTPGAMTPGIMTPGAFTSGLSSPFYAHSRAGSHENLAAFGVDGAVPPAALSSRLLQHASLTESGRGPLNRTNSEGTTTPHTHAHDSEHPPEWSNPGSGEMSRRTSGEEASHPNTPPEPEHQEYPDLQELSKVPSYTTATRAPLPRTASYIASLGLPSYQSATSAPVSPARTPPVDPMSMAAIAEGATTPSSRPLSGFGPLVDRYHERRARTTQTRGG